MKRPWLAGLLAVVALARPAAAAEVQVSFPAIERLIWSSLLTQGGRLYLQGTPEDTCRFAFVQEPKVSGAEGRLVVRFVFSGRAGVQIAGRCAGPGDTLPLTATGVPVYADGDLRLSDLKLDAPDSAYYRAVAGLLQGLFERKLRFGLRAQLERSLAEASANAAVRLGLQGFAVRSLLVDADGLRVVFDGTLTAR